MNVKYAILGFLSWQSFSGYDLKKLFIDSLFIFWSGNNNQIYRTLVQLAKEGLVSVVIQNQESGPSRKIYTITEKGRAELRLWVMTSPELPQLRNTFLVQLAWADQLNSGELDVLLEKYEYEVEMQLALYQEKKRRNQINPSRTKREQFLWDSISNNVIESFENELAWVNKLRSELSEMD